jgi:hypothetical protein
MIHESIFHGSHCERHFQPQEDMPCLQEEANYFPKQKRRTDSLQALRRGVSARGGS